jgi:asparagine N-glycosylation enzyme membrane subunit Stt3
MAKLFEPNIDNRGRLVRGVMGALLLAGGLFAVFSIWWLGLILLASAAFVLFEAIRGWCGLRACGIKTKL